MRVLVVTTVHNPLDARIHRRQIGALVAEGCRVTYLAPWKATATRPPDAANVAALDVPRAVGRRRLRSLIAARQALRQLAPKHDIVLLHDPELLLALVGRRWQTPVAWDVHEDVAASLIDRAWVPSYARVLLAYAAKKTELFAEQRVHLILAEAAYQERFRLQHPYVPNVPWMPEAEPSPPDDHRIVYVGRIARSRGAVEMVALAHRLKGAVPIDLYGPADADVRPLVEEAARQGLLRWHGFVPNAEALRLIEGACVGLSLIEPQPNHAISLQTKVLEYLSRRVPVVTSDLPVTGAFVRKEQVGLVVPFGDVGATHRAVLRLLDDVELRHRFADRGYELVRSSMSWDREGPRFVEQLREWSRSG